MKSKPKKHYHSHKFNNTEESFIKLNKGPPTVDRRIMTSQLVPIYKYLDLHGIKQYEKISQYIHSIGLKRTNEIELIVKLQDYIKYEFIKERELNKSNSCERNMVWNRIVLEYSTQTLEFVNSYLIKYHPEIKNKDEIISNLKVKFEDLKNQDKIGNKTCTKMEEEETENQNFLFDWNGDIDSLFDCPKITFTEVSNDLFFET